MLRRSPVITGIGIISAAGCGLASVWETVRANRSGLGPLTLFPSPRFGNHLVGQVREDVDTLAGEVRGSRSDKLAWIAAREALATAKLDSGLGNVSPARTGVILGSTVGGMLGTEKVLATLLRENKHRFGPLRYHECASAANLCARKMGALGPVSTVSTACSAGAMAILIASELIERGEADLMLAGAGDSLARLTLNGFGSLLLLDPNGCRPFDARRTGISLGEGAAMLVIETEETATARGATILARLSGWGASCDAFHATAPQTDGNGAFAAMSRALEQGGLAPGDIDFVSTHGTATPDNDLMEAKALKRLFGNQLPSVASVKRIFGHTLAASGAIKAVLAVQSLREQAVPGTPGFETADEKIGLEPVKEFRAQPVSRILSNSFGFGGNNVALVFERANVRPHIHTGQTAARKFAIFGAGIISPAGNSPAAIAASFRSGETNTSQFEVPSFSPGTQTDVHACAHFAAEQFIDPAKRRKLSRIQQMAMVAAKQAWNADLARQVASGDVCVSIGTGLGSLNDTAAFVENMILKDERAPRPSLFAGSVHNSLASQVAIELQLVGPNTTPVQGDISWEIALWLGTNELSSGRAKLALAGAADELNQYHLAAGLRRGWWKDACAAQLPGEGCAIFTIGHVDIPAPPLAFVSAVRIGRCESRDAQAEARWIAGTLERDGIASQDVDSLLMRLHGESARGEFSKAVAAEFSNLAGHEVNCFDWQHACGDHHSASAFGFAAAIGMVRKEIAPEKNCKTVVLFTLSPTGTKGMSCVFA